MRKKKKDDVVACVMAFIPRGLGGWGCGVEVSPGIRSDPDAATFMCRSSSDKQIYFHYSDNLLLD